MSSDKPNLTIEQLAFHLINEKVLYDLPYPILLKEVVNIYNTQSHVNSQFSTKFSNACIEEAIKRININEPNTIIANTSHLLNTLAFFNPSEFATSIANYTNEMMHKFPIFSSKSPNGTSNLIGYLLKGVSNSNLENKEFAHSMIHYSSRVKKNNRNNI